MEEYPKFIPVGDIRARNFRQPPQGEWQIDGSLVGTHKGVEGGGDGGRWEWKEAHSQAVCPNLAYRSHLSGTCSAPCPGCPISHTSFNPPIQEVVTIPGPVFFFYEETEARRGK